MKITRRQLRQIIKEELGIRLNEEEVDIQALGDLVPKRAIQKMVHSLLDDAYGEKINLGYSGERDPKDGTAIPGAISSVGMSGGKHSFDITYSIDMKNPKKVDRIWNNKVRGKAGFRGYYDDNQELDNRGNKIFKMSLSKRPYVADSEFVEFVVRITMSDNWVAENSKKLKKEALDLMNESVDLTGFWDHGTDEVVEEDGKLMALGSAPVSPGMSSLARTGANSIARGKLAKHLDNSSPIGSRPSRSKTIGKTYYVVMEMPAP